MLYVGQIPVFRIRTDTEKYFVDYQIEIPKTALVVGEILSMGKSPYKKASF